MAKKRYIVILLLVSLLGFSFSYYNKYIKSYLPEVEKTITNSKESYVHSLNLNENIAFLEKMEDAKTMVGIADAEGDTNKEALRHLKTVNWISIATMLLFGLFFMWALFFLFRFQKSVNNR